MCARCQTRRSPMHTTPRKKSSTEELLRCADKKRPSAAKRKGYSSGKGSLSCLCFLSFRAPLCVFSLSFFCVCPLLAPLFSVLAQTPSQSTYLCVCVPVCRPDTRTGSLVRYLASKREEDSHFKVPRIGDVAMSRDDEETNRDAAVRAPPPPHTRAHVHRVPHVIHTPVLVIPTRRSSHVVGVWFTGATT